MRRFMIRCGGLFSGTRILYFFAGSEDYFIVTGLGVLLHNLFRHVMSSYFIRGFIPVILPPQISKMAEKVASFKTGGALWFTDLTTADTSFIFPLLTGLTFWIAVECDAIVGFEGLMLPKHWTRMWIIPMFVMGIFFSKGVHCYLISCILFSIAFMHVKKH